MISLFIAVLTVAACQCLPLEVNGPQLPPPIQETHHQQLSPIIPPHNFHAHPVPEVHHEQSIPHPSEAHPISQNHPAPFIHRLPIYEEHPIAHQEHPALFSHHHHGHVDHRYHHQPEYHSSPKYDFGYNIFDPRTGDIKNQYEHRNGGFVRGTYSFIEADGQRRIVDYSSDPLKGFNAFVRHEPLGHGSSW
ncbi:hypothetical protein ACFFRR_003390 [Megaselia abdita]